MAHGLMSRNCSHQQTAAVLYMCTAVQQEPNRSISPGWKCTEAFGLSKGGNCTQKFLNSQK